MSRIDIIRRKINQQRQEFFAEWPFIVETDKNPWRERLLKKKGHVSEMDEWLCDRDHDRYINLIGFKDERDAFEFKMRFC
jgi:hypothetical protein